MKTNTENKDRNRYYGHRIGDLVDTGLNNLGQGVVTAYGKTDNNRIIVEVGKGNEFSCVAEWCETIKKVEDI